MPSEETPSPLFDEYEQALFEFSCAKEELEAVLHKLHQAGVYPSPPDQIRFHLQDERGGATHKFEIGLGETGIEGYLTCNNYTDGRPGELFITAEKEGTFVSGLLDAFATVFSIALQSGVPLESLIKKFRHIRFDPAGMAKNPKIRTASSVLDYVMHWLELKYIGQGEKNDG